MTEHKNDQYSQQPPGNSVRLLVQHSPDPDLNNANIIVPETEEWDEEVDVVITDQRRPQFRFSENYGRRNF